MGEAKPRVWRMVNGEGEWVGGEEGEEGEEESVGRRREGFIFAGRARVESGTYE